MTGAETRALAPFLRFLGTFPDPGAVAQALTKGPLVGFRALTCTITMAVEDDLINISDYGFAADAVERYRGISIRADVPLCVAFRENRILVAGTDTLLDDYEALAIDRHLWERLIERIGPGEVVNVPVLSQGVVVGGYAYIAPSRDRWTTDDYAMLDGIGAALGLWMTHPASGLTSLLNAPGSALREQVSLTDRQVRILLLVEVGRSNTAIASDLSVSESTVKQEIQRILRILRVDDRHSAVTLARQIGLLE